MAFYKFVLDMGEGRLLHGEGAVQTQGAGGARLCAAIPWHLSTSLKLPLLIIRVDHTSSVFIFLGLYSRSVVVVVYEMIHIFKL